MTGLSGSLAACSHAPAIAPEMPLRLAGEVHLDHLRMLTHGGVNRSARWSFDGSRLVFESRKGSGCPRILAVREDGVELRDLSGKRARSEIPSFLPGDERIVFTGLATRGPTPSEEACTMPAVPAAQPLPEPEPKTAVDPGMLLFSAKSKDGADPLPLEPAAPLGFNSEAAVCKDGSVVFTSDRDGDLDLYGGKLDRLGTLPVTGRLTQTEGYDGQASFSPDCKRIVWSAARPVDAAATAGVHALLKHHLRPDSRAEIWIADADGSHPRQVTRLGSLSGHPVFTPDGERILFSTNWRNGDHSALYLIRTDGTQLERVTYSDGSDTDPSFSPDGKKLVFSSSRQGFEPGELNLLIADWAEQQSLATQNAYSSEEAVERYQATVRKLSSPEMEGRGMGSTGLARAENWVGEQLAAIGLQPLFDHAFAQRVETATRSGKILTGRNLAATWGQACGRAPALVIGAHLDHLGRGGPGSPEPALPKGFYPGADSNASGVAAVLEAARVVAAGAPSPDCTIFAVFTGQEYGNQGSERLVRYLRDAYRPGIKGMINLDMVGRLEGNRVIVAGWDSAQAWPPLLSSSCAAEGLQCDLGEDGYAPGDDTSFDRAAIPALHLFTGTHADYHRTTDTADKINAPGGLQIARLAARLATEAGDRTFALRYSKPTTLVAAAASPVRGYLGAIPDYSSTLGLHAPSEPAVAPSGVRLAGARPGSPASRAGVKPGDLLTVIERTSGEDPQGARLHPTRTLEELMAVLDELHPQDSIVLHLRRGTQSLSLPVLVGKRGP